MSWRTGSESAKAVCETINRITTRRVMAVRRCTRYASDRNPDLGNLGRTVDRLPHEGADSATIHDGFHGSSGTAANANDRVQTDGLARLRTAQHLRAACGRCKTASRRACYRFEEQR